MRQLGGAGTASGHDDVRVVVPEGTAAPATVPPGIFASAAGAYRSGQRLDMQSLARQAGVGRATLYRRVGNREQLLDEVIWWRARRLLVYQVRATAALAGVARITAVIGGVLGAVERDKPLRAFLDSDPEAALRILTGTRSRVQQGMAGALENLIGLERSRGAFEAGLDTPRALLRDRAHLRGIPVRRRDRGSLPRRRPGRHRHRGPAARPRPGAPPPARDGRI